MRRAERYTVPFPAPIPPPAALYEEKFRAFPFWYRWLLRLRALFTASSVERVTRMHHLQELRRQLEKREAAVVDPAIPALLPAFHRAVRTLMTELTRISVSLEEATGLARGTFLRETLAEAHPDVHAALLRSAALEPERAADPTLTLDGARREVQTRLRTALEDHVEEIERTLGPIWLALRTLNLLQRIDLDLLLPVQGARREETPLRVVSSSLQQLHQTIELCHRHINTNATEYAWAFARRRLRTRPGTPGGVWSAIESFRATVPLLDLVRYAEGEPFLDLPPLRIKSDWWSPFQNSWHRLAADAIPDRLMQERHQRVRELVSSVFLIDREPPVWIPGPLYPRTVWLMLLLAADHFFNDTRRVVTQLVIDATFHHLDTRNALHQAALELDQAMERLSTLLGSTEHRGTLGDEIQRLQQRSGASSLVRRQLTGLYERYRPRVRTAMDSAINALETGGTLISRTLFGSEGAFEARELRPNSVSSEVEAHELLRVVADHWYDLGRQLRGLMQLENELSGRDAFRTPDLNTDRQD